MEKTPKYQLNVRIAPGTQEQVDDLVKSKGWTLTQLVTLAIDRMYWQECPPPAEGAKGKRIPKKKAN